MSPEENLEMLDSIQKSAFSGITELNLSCPNVPGKPQLAYDFQATEQLLEKVFAFFKNLWVLSFRHILTWHISIKWLIFLTSFLTYVNSVNSVGNALYIDTEEEAVVIKPKMVSAVLVVNTSNQLL